MKRAVVYSIPGTGARFTMNFLDSCLGYQITSLESLFEMPADVPFYAHLHVGERVDRLQKIIAKGDVKIIIPLRSPVHQYLSRRFGKPNAAAQTIAQWAQLRGVMPLFDYQLLPVESMHDRTRMLMAVADHINAAPNKEVLHKLAADWPKIGRRKVRHDETVDPLFFQRETEWYDETLVNYEVVN